MMLTVLVTGWLMGSVPLGLLLGRMISGADAISAEVQRPSRVPRLIRAA